MAAGMTDRLYLPPAHFSVEGESGQMVMPGLGDGNSSGRIPALPVELYDLGVKAGEARGGHGGAPIPAADAGKTCGCTFDVGAARFEVRDVQDHAEGLAGRALSAPLGWTAELDNSIRLEGSGRTF